MSEFLAWDTYFWGHAIYRAARADEPQRGELMWLLIPAEDIAHAQEAGRLGWALMDVRVEFEHALGDSFGPRRDFVSTREWQERDLPALVELARSAHRITRFYADPRLEAARCDDLYAGWIRNSCAGWAQAVFVSKTGDSYVTVHRHEAAASIGLIAVAEEHRGQGIGTWLVHRALEWASDEGCERITVVTQGRNIPAQRVFERCGFVTSATSLWFHRWVDDAPA